MQGNNSAKRRVASQIFLLYFRATYRFVSDYIWDRVLLFVPRRLKSLKLKFVLGFIIFMIVLIQISLVSNFKILKIYTTPTPSLIVMHKPQVESKHTNLSKENVFPLRIPSEAEFRRSLVEKKLERLAKHSERLEITNMLSAVMPPAVPTTCVHIFYYTSYTNFDGQWKLWTSSTPNNSGDCSDIASNYYPQLGCYRSGDPLVVSSHFKQIRDTGVGVVVASWKLHDDVLPTLLDIAGKYQLKVAPHLQAVKGFDVDNVVKYIQNITLEYTKHPSFYKINKNGRILPVYYIFESYLTVAEVWREILASDGKHSIRGTPYDGIFIGLLRDNHHKYHIQKSHFDGFYTYFPSNGYTYSSSWKNWKTLQSFATKHKLLFLPSVSPGYVDTRVRPRNSALIRHRSRGHYYQAAWRSAMGADTVGVTITSFNDWQCGSQIEPAVAKTLPHFTYLDYEPEGPSFYLNLTRYWVRQFVSQNVKDKKSDISIKI